MIATLATRRKELEKEEAALKQYVGVGSTICIYLRAANGPIMLRLQDAHAALAEELEKAQQGLLGAQAGMAGGANTCKSFADQLRGKLLYCVVFDTCAHTLHRCVCSQTPRTRRVWRPQRCSRPT